MTDDLFDLDRLRQNFIDAERAKSPTAEGRRPRRARPRILRTEVLALLQPLEASIRARLDDREPAVLLLSRVRALLSEAGPGEPIEEGALAEAEAALGILEDYLEAKLLVRGR